MGLADIPPPLTEGESHLKGVYTRFIKYLRCARTTQSGINTLEAEAGSEPAHSQEATNPSRENPRVNDFTPGGPPPPDEVENVTHPSREVTQGEPPAKEREQDLKKVTSIRAFDDDSAENSETRKDEVSQFFSSRPEEYSIAKGTSSQVDAPFKSSHRLTRFRVTTPKLSRRRAPSVLEQRSQRVYHCQGLLIRWGSSP